MMIVGMIAIAFFALIGTASFVTALMRLNDADEKMSLILWELRADDAEDRVRRAARLCDRIRCPRLICRCADEEAEMICEKLKREYRIIEIR